MKRIYILLLVLAVSLSCLADKYLIYSGDALLGTEEVTVFDNKIITKTTLNASGVQLSYTQTLTLSSGKPSQYQANINGVVNITGSFADGEATYTVANQKRTFKGNGLYPVENNTFYLWSYVLKTPHRICSAFAVCLGKSGLQLLADRTVPDSGAAGEHPAACSDRLFLRRQNGQVHHSAPEHRCDP